MQNTSRTKRNTSSKGVSTAVVIPGKKVYVGMSGGVDSAVSALLLKQAGYDITGVFIKVWQPDLNEHEQSRGIDCGWKAERRDAMRVAAKLDIPFLTFDFSKEYKKEVVDYMIAEYKAGKTPNPDIMCNRHVKFGSFLKEALSRGVDYVATGHYAQNVHDTTSGKFQLHEGADKNKDQSYFLWTLTKKDLKHILFPVGHLQKSEVRSIAERNDLPVFDKKDSQGVCFIGHVDMKEFLREHIKTKKGKVLDMEGKIIGEHDGAALYTPGERHGFIIYNKGEKGTHNEPHYIVSKDIKKNTITVAPESAFKNRLAEHASKEASLKNVSWVGGALGDAPDPKKTYSVRIRYRQEKQACRIKTENAGKKSGQAGSVKLIFDKPQKGMAEGQSAVIYDGETCLGGGILGPIA